MSPLIPLDELEPHHLAAWRGLAARAVEPNPFFEPAFVLPAARHLGRPDLALLVVEGADREWLACMPLSRRRTWLRANIPVLAAWVHLYAFVGTPLVEPTAVEPATERLIEQIFAATRLGVAALPWLGDDGPVSEGLHAALQARGFPPALRRSFERRVIHRSGLNGGTDGLITSRHRRDLRRLGKRLAEELDAPLEFRDDSDRGDAVNAFITLESSGWKGARGTAMGSRREHLEFFRELCDGFRASGRLQLFSFGSADRAISYKCNLLAGEAVFYFKVAFDESFARYRPGLQLEVQMLEYFLHHMDQAWIDSCSAPDSVLFTRLFPERRRLGSYVVVRRPAVRWTLERLAHPWLD